MYSVSTSGRARRYLNCPSVRVSIRPACVNSLRWCETVACATGKHSATEPQHISPPDAAIVSSISKRRGSESALATLWKCAASIKYFSSFTARYIYNHLYIFVNPLNVCFDFVEIMGESAYIFHIRFKSQPPLADKL